MRKENLKRTIESIDHWIARGSVSKMKQSFSQILVSFIMLVSIAYIILQITPKIVNGETKRSTGTERHGGEKEKQLSWVYRIELKRSMKEIMKVCTAARFSSYNTLPILVNSKFMTSTYKFCVQLQMWAVCTHIRNISCMNSVSFFLLFSCFFFIFCFFRWLSSVFSSCIFRILLPIFEFLFTRRVNNFFQSNEKELWIINFQLKI